MTEIYIPDDEEHKQKVMEISKALYGRMDDFSPVPFDIGLNALIMVMASAIKTVDKPYEYKVKLARAVGEAIIANLYLDGAPN